MTEESIATAEGAAGSLAVAQGKCQGHGRCYAVAPDLLTDDEEGFVAQAGQVLPISVALAEQARAAADACPEWAIDYRVS
ncbi:ferredoxin [Rhodococcus gannanensis]|uniref:Ferredoxin n=1 Tax=Rhodococcus gannanensis TaxID=1960308 RepID=A0ABW4PAX6_9NOCA